MATYNYTEHRHSVEKTLDIVLYQVFYALTLGTTTKQHSVQIVRMYRVFSGGTQYI
jgi:hypothetical protein